MSQEEYNIAVEEERKESERRAEKYMAEQRELQDKRDYEAYLKLKEKFKDS